MRVLGSMAIAVSSLLALALWLFTSDTTAAKVAVEIRFLILMVVLVSSMAVVSACTVARVRDGKLNFYFCGIRTRSFVLDSETTFELKKIGRMAALTIRRGRSCYYPNGSLNKEALVNLLRTNGVAEWQAD